MKSNDFGKMKNCFVPERNFGTNLKTVVLNRKLWKKMKNYCSKEELWQK
jgi:hypothetical protein